MSLFLVVVLVHLVLQFFATTASEECGNKIEARGRNAALGTYSQITTVVRTQVRIPQQKVGTFKARVCQEHEAGEHVDKVKEALAATKEARKERDDPGTKADDGVGDGNTLNSCKGRIIWDQVVGIAPLVAINRAFIAEKPKR